MPIWRVGDAKTIPSQLAPGERRGQSGEMDPLVLAGLPLLPVALVLWMRRRHPAMPRGGWVSQSEAAILHRRLHRGVDETRRAVARAGAGVSIDQLNSLTEDLDAQAIAIDAKLVKASQLPGKTRHKALVELKYR